VSDKVKKTIEGMGLSIVATKPEDRAHAMTAIYLPEGVAIPDVIPKLLSKGIIFAAGIHKEIGSKYIRFGHMGVSVVSSHAPHLFGAELTFISFLPQMDPNRNDIDKALTALKDSLTEAGYKA
jgi:alanine-glyoxylate transaminase/serine-glyoxylate transaminase/serine-pyruvate transaminase